MNHIGIAALAMGVVGALSACGTTVIRETAAQPTPKITVTQTATPAPAPTYTVRYVPVPARPQPYVPVTSYAQDITNAGIVAPVGWINATGATLCADWASGMSWAETDAAVLTPGGVYAYHLGLYDSITSADLCPGS